MRRPTPSCRFRDDYFLDGGFTLLDHGHGVSTCYLHQSKRLVKEGDKLARGDVIGLVGQTGRATGPHTHWGLNWFQLKLDPSLAAATPAPPKSLSRLGQRRWIHSHCEGRARTMVSMASFIFAVSARTSRS